MTISSELNRVELVGDGTLGPYGAIPYHFFKDEDLTVWLRDNTTQALTLQMLNSDYSVAGANTPPTGQPGSPSGTITFLITAPTTGQTVVVWRTPPHLQATSFPAFGGVPLPVYEANYDLHVEMFHIYQRDRERMIRLADGATGQALVIPAGSVDRLLALDESGDLALRLSSGTVFWAAPTDPPDPALGADGDLALSPTGVVYQKVNGAWVDTGTNLTGPSGAVGIDGAIGLNVVVRGAAAASEIKGSAHEIDDEGNLTGVAGIQIEKQIELLGEISATLTGDVKDWAPTGHATASTIRVSGDGDYFIRGLAGGTKGRFVHIANVDASKTFGLISQDATSAAANRFAFPANIALPPTAALTLKYDLDLARWLAVSGEGISLYANQNWPGVQRSGLVATDASIDLSLGQNFVYTQAAADELSFTGIVDGVTGVLKIIKDGTNGLTTAAASISWGSAGIPTELSGTAAGTHYVSYVSDAALGKVVCALFAAAVT